MNWLLLLISCSVSPSLVQTSIPPIYVESKTTCVPYVLKSFDTRADLEGYITESQKPFWTGVSVDRPNAYAVDVKTNKVFRMVAVEVKKKVKVTEEREVHDHYRIEMQPTTFEISEGTR
jgi:hypothetical protein